MRYLALIFICSLPYLGFGQTSPKKYWFQFTDKDNTPYSLSQPLEFLSQRALDRRERQGIALDEKDLPVDPAYIQAVLDEGAGYLVHSKWFNSVSVVVPNDDVRDSILSLPFVVSADPVGKRPDPSITENKFAPWAEAKSITLDEFSETDYGSTFNQINMLGGVSLHNQGFRGEGMLIAVLDAGFPNVDQFPVFDSLITDGRLLGGWDFVDQDNSIFEDNSHGQSVLSTMAGYIPGSFIGTAPKASYLLLRTEDGNTEFPIEMDYWVAGAEYADSAGADVINSSLGYTTFDGSMFDYEYADMDGNTLRGSIGADIAASRGILVVNSAGNSGDNPWQYIGAPADGDSVLAVGAVRADGERVSFSSIGPSADGDIKPNVCAQGFQATIINSGGSIAAGNGTSFAGPIMAGMAACLFQAHRDSLTNMDVFHAIERSAHKYNNPDHLYGYGIPNFAKAHLLLQGLNPASEDFSELLLPYPNPFSDSFTGTFYSAARQEILVRLVNNLGQEIKRIEVTMQPLSGFTFQFSDLQDLNEGIYTLHVDADSGSYFKKLVKVRQD
ncbi:MAG: S8 family serine peptidase [Flavobacteriales bacterium]|nr:S8 family serine peptidase [Flavobacteriales bacterium]MCB9205012.1 S8 family serine peptidase [Flavobacteriales bacterium]